MKKNHPKIELLKSIDILSCYTKNQKQIFKTMIMFSDHNNHVILGAEEIAKRLKITSACVRSAIKKFTQQNIVTSTKNSGFGYITFIIDIDKLNEIIELYTQPYFKEEL